MNQSKKYTAEDLQMDLLDAIAEAEAKQQKHGLHPALERWQKEYDKTLELCNGWKNGIKNELGVYIENVREFKVEGRNNCRVRLYLVRDGISVHGTVDYDASIYGASYPLTDKSPIHFLVTEDKYQAVSGMTLKVNAKILDDPNIDDEYLNTMTTLAGKACDMAEKEI